jgi:hypothetical protein
LGGLLPSSFRALRSAFRAGALSLALAVSLAPVTFAQQWRTFAGGFSSRWNTIGHHGHDQNLCASGDCDADDFGRANLDDSIGFRAGRERDFFSAGALRIVGGADASVNHTEYNRSQRDFSVVSVAMFAGADLEIAGVRIGARYGAGGYATTTAEQSGAIRFIDVDATIPLRRGAGVRIARRTFEMTRMGTGPSRDISIAFVTSADARGESNWEFGTATGTTIPGAGAGGDRKLRSTSLNRMSVLRTFRNVQFELSWSSTAHESSVPSVFRGYGGNFRSKTIEGYGLGVAQSRALTRALSLRWSGGLELADWRDDHKLLTRDGNELVAGVELALTASAGLRLQLQPRLAIESSLQKVYWRALDLGELRWTTGIVLTR